MTDHSDIHPRHSVRLKEYDYSSEGLDYNPTITMGKDQLFIEQ